MFCFFSTAYAVETKTQELFQFQGYGTNNIINKFILPSVGHLANDERSMEVIGSKKSDIVCEIGIDESGIGLQDFIGQNGKYACIQDEKPQLESEFCACLDHITINESEKKDIDLAMEEIDNRLKSFIREKQMINRDKELKDKLLVAKTLIKKNVFDDNFSCVPGIPLRFQDKNNFDEYKKKEKTLFDAYRNNALSTLDTHDENHISPDAKLILDILNRFYDGNYDSEHFEVSDFNSSDQTFYKERLKKKNAPNISFNSKQSNLNMQSIYSNFYKKIIQKIARQPGINQILIREGNNQELKTLINKEIQDEVQNICNNELDSEKFHEKAELTAEVERIHRIFTTNVNPNLMNNHLSQIKAFLPDSNTIENGFHFDKYFCSKRKAGRESLRKAEEVVRQNQQKINDFQTKLFNLDKKEEKRGLALFNLEQRNKAYLKEIKALRLDKNVNFKTLNLKLKEQAENQTNIIAILEAIKQDNVTKRKLESSQVQLIKMSGIVKSEGEAIAISNHISDSRITNREKLQRYTALDHALGEGGKSLESSKSKSSTLKKAIQSSIIAQAIGPISGEKEYLQKMEEKEKAVAKAIAGDKTEYLALKKNEKKEIEEEILVLRKNITPRIRDLAMKEMKRQYRDDPKILKEIVNIEKSQIQSNIQKQEIAQTIETISKSPKTQTAIVSNEKEIEKAVDVVNKQFSKKMNTFNEQALQRLEKVVQKNTTLSTRVNDLKERELQNNRLAKSLKKQTQENEVITDKAIADIADISKSLNVDKIPDKKISAELLAKQNELNSLRKQASKLLNDESKKPKNITNRAPANVADRQKTDRIPSNTFQSSRPRNLRKTIPINRNKSINVMHREAVTNIAGIQNAIIAGAPIIPKEELSIYLNSDLSIPKEMIAGAPKELVLKTNKGVMVLKRSKVGAIDKYEVTYRSGKLDLAQYLLVEKLDIIHEEELVFESYSNLLTNFASVE